MIKTLALVASLLATNAVAQPATPYRTDSNAQSTNDPNKIVCQKEEKIGSRLAAKKVCMTVGEWKARQQADRDQLDSTQSGARAACSADSIQSCDPDGPF